RNSRLGQEELVMPKKKTKETKEIEKFLREHFPDYSREYPPEAYRYNSASIRVRLISDAFQGKDRADREDMVLPLIQQLPDDTQADIMVLLLLTPEEMEQSLMNQEFEEPTPSRI